MGRKCCRAGAVGKCRARSSTEPSFGLNCTTLKKNSGTGTTGTPPEFYLKLRLPLHAEEEEGSSSLPVPDTSRPVQGGSAPLTPPVLQTQPLLARHLPPPVLPFQDFAARVAETALEREVAEEQQAARRIMEESEEQTHHSHSATTDELEQARQTIRLLEQGQVGTGAPSFTPTLTPPGGGCTSHLTLGQPVPAFPCKQHSSPVGGYQRETSASSFCTYYCSHQGVGSVSSGLPSLSGVGSVPGVACPVYASPSPHTPQACLYPNMAGTIAHCTS